MLSDTDLILAYAREQRRRGYQPSTIDKRTTSLRCIAASAGPLLELTTEDIEMFLDRRRRVVPGRAADLSAKTRYGYIDCLHGFYEWARRVGHTETDPTAEVVRPRLHRNLPRPIATPDLDVALKLAPARERAMLSLACFEGLRCIEIARLTREDILDGETPPVIVAFGKGAKRRVVPLHPDTWDALTLLPLPKAGPVFRLADGRRMRGHNVSHAGCQYLAAMGIPAVMHQLRHWYATQMYRRTRDLRLVQDLLGHESSRSTEIYTQVDRSGADAAVRSLTTGS